MDDDKQRRLGVAIWEHIASGGQTHQPTADAVANLYSIDVERDGPALSLKPHSLLDVFNAGLGALGLAVPSTAAAAAPVAPAAATTTTTGPPEAASASSTVAVGFEKFLASLKKTKFFDGVVEGTPEYSARVAKAQAKYDQKYGASNASRSASQGGSAVQDAASASTARVDKGEAEVFKTQGNEAIRREDYPAALTAYSDAIKNDPANAVYYSNRAAAYIYLADYSSAVGDCQKAIALDSSFLRPRERLASAYRHLGMYDEEITALEQALSIDPSNTKFEADLKVARTRVQVGPPAAPAAPPGMPDLSAMMSNPAFGAMASQLQQNGGLEGLMNNPAIAQMAAQFMGGAGGPPVAAPGGAPGRPAGGPTGPSPPGSQEAYRNAAESLGSNPRLAGLMDQASRDPMAAIQSAMQDPAAMQDIMQAMGPMLGGGGVPGMPPQPPPSNQ